MSLPRPRFASRDGRFRRQATVSAVTPDRAVAHVATLQHGVVAMTQLLAAGLTDAGVRRRVAAGRLHRLHRGVYAVGHTALSPIGVLLAATLACGRDAVVSHAPPPRCGACCRSAACRT